MINIIDPRDFKMYKVKDLKVVYYDIPNKNGETENVKCVEYTVIGKRHEWSNWMLFREFEKANYDIAKSL